MLSLIPALLLFVFFISIVVFLTPADRKILLQKYNNFTHDDKKRSYLIHTPAKPVKKIILALHGFSDSARRYAYYTALHNVVDDETIVIYPEAIAPVDAGVKRGWNAEFCCGSGFLQKEDDVGFLISLSKYINETYAGNNAQIYVTGFSNGGFMTHRLASEYPDVLSGAAIVAGATGTEQRKITPIKPVNILLIHGEKDRIVPFAGGAGSSDPEFKWLPFSALSNTWETVNNNEKETKIIIHENDGHKWHGWRLANFWHKKPKASIEVVNFFNNGND